MPVNEGASVLAPNFHSPQGMTCGCERGASYKGRRSPAWAPHTTRHVTAEEAVTDATDPNIRPTEP